MMCHIDLSVIVGRLKITVFVLYKGVFVTVMWLNMDLVDDRCRPYDQHNEALLINIANMNSYHSRE